MRSMDAERIERVLAEFGMERGLPGLQFSDEGTCALDHPSGLCLVLELSPDASVIHWYSHICTIPHDHREAFYLRLLEMNLLGVRTNGASLGIDSTANEVVLSYTSSVRDLDLIQMNNITDNFLESALNILSEIAEENPANVSSGDSDLIDHSMLQFRV